MTVTSQDTIPASPDGDQSGSSIDYEALHREAQLQRGVPHQPTEVEPPVEVAKPRRETVMPLDEYSDLADQIVRTRQYQASHPGSKEDSGPDALRKIYEFDEQDERLNLFAELLIDAPHQAANEAWLESHQVIRDDYARDKADKLKLEACKFNHVLRSVILRGRASFGRDIGNPDESLRANNPIKARRTIEEFLARETEDISPGFAHKLVAGIVAEIALYDALRQVPGVEDVQFTDVRTDFRDGTDIIATYKDGERVGYDAKSDPNIRKVGHKDFGYGLSRFVTIGVPANAISGLRLSREGEESFVDELDRLMSARV